MSNFDVFNEGKTQSFFDSQQAVMALCTYLEGVNKNMEELSKNQLLEYFNKLLQVSILFTSSIHENQLSEVNWWCEHVGRSDQRTDKYLTPDPATKHKWQW